MASPALADFRVCNGTQNLVGVAIGYRAKDGWNTEGWWQVPASTCATLIEGELQSRYYYLYAEDAARGTDCGLGLGARLELLGHGANVGERNRVRKALRCHG